MGVALRAGLGRANRVNGHEWGFAHGFGLTVMKPICICIRDKHFRNPDIPNPNIMKFTCVAALALLASFVMSKALGGVLVVPGTSDIWLAGTPDGTAASLEDVAPGQSPVLAGGVVAGGSYSFVVTGSVNNFPGPSGLGPDGGQFYEHSTGAENGLSGLHAPINSLVGVFLDSSSPLGQPVLGGLDFASIGLDFPSLSPGLRQPFFIGDGMTGTQAVQTFTAPSGATRLFLGTMDGYGWWNNDGAFTVTVNGPAVPEPSAYAMVAGLALLGFGWHRRHSRR